MTLDQSGTPKLVPAAQGNELIISVIQVLTAISAALGFVMLGWLFRKERSFRHVIALVILGILGNVLTCVALSAVAHRYEARVIWLIPLFALALHFSIRPANNAVLRPANVDSGN